MRFMPAARVALILALCAPPALSAQGAGAGSGPASSVLTLDVGATKMSVDAINARLVPAGYASLSNDAITYGASGHVAVGRALLGAELAQATFGEEGLNNGRTSDLNSRFALATVGYALFASPHLTAYPSLGVGAGRVDVTVRNRNSVRTATPQPTFDEIVQSPGTESTLSGHHLLFSVGAGADYLVTRSSSSTWGVVLGVRAGWMLAPNRTTWSSEGQPVGAGPDGGPGGPFLRVVAGIGR